jgi:hypothetical protein
VGGRREAIRPSSPENRHSPALCAIAHQDRGSSTPRAIVSITSASEYWMPAGACHRARIRNDVATQLSVLATPCVRGVEKTSAQKEEGAGKTGCALHPRSHVQNAQSKAHTSIQVQRKQSGLPCAMVLRLISCSPGETWLVCHRRSRDAKHHREFDTSHWGVRTTRLRRPRLPRSSVAAIASIAPHPNVSDDGQRNGMARMKK